VTGAHDDDRGLAAAFLRGDEPAFRELYRRHTPRVYALVRRLLGGRHADAEDVMQETWLRAARGLGGFRWESSLRTWLTGIALNLCRERSRRQADSALESEPATPPPVPVDVDLERAVAGLSDGYRQVLILHDVWGLTHEEVGQALGIDAGTSKSQLSRARRLLKERLAGPWRREGVS
jgi:RNA polymerase sigma-70 factor (ECF subfamily)